MERGDRGGFFMEVLHAALLRAGADPSYRDVESGRFGQVGPLWKLGSYVGLPCVSADAPWEWNGMRQAGQLRVYFAPGWQSMVWAACAYAWALVCPWPVLLQGTEDAINGFQASRGLPQTGTLEGQCRGGP